MLSHFTAFVATHTPVQQFVLWLLVCSPLFGLGVYLLFALCHFTGKLLGIEEDPKFGPLNGLAGIVAGILMAIPLANLFIIATVLWNVCSMEFRDLLRKLEHRCKQA